jgi:3-oxoadipyl-CoA thiolase
MIDAYICDGIRTPFGRFRGRLSAVRADDLAALPIQALLARHGALDPAAVDDVYLGCANQAGEDNRNVARMAALLAGLPSSVPGVTVNRLCASGLEALGQAARACALEEAELLIAGGVESMTRAPYVLGKADVAHSREQKLEDTTLGWRFVNPRLQALHGVDSMTQTAENLAREHGISRADQDAFAARSQQRAAAAIGLGWFQDELTSVPAVGKGPPFEADEHPRADSTLAALAALPPILGPGTSITAGNASGINDGACALLVASAAGLARHGLVPRARILGMAAHGVAPRVMGIGPVGAVHKLLARLRLRLEDFDVIEINEAFAAQVLAVTRSLGLPDDAPQVNPNGGAIALGHPLGASGARLALTALRQLERTQGRRALVTLCVGVGQGLALALERPG